MAIELQNNIWVWLPNWVKFQLSTKKLSILRKTDYSRAVVQHRKQGSNSRDALRSRRTCCKEVRRTISVINNVMAAQPNIDGAVCESCVIPFLVPRRKVWLALAVSVPCSNAANIGDRKTWTQSEFCTWQNSVRGARSPRKCICSVPAQETAKHRAKFGWPPLSDVGAVTKPRRETCWNLLGCPKLTNRSQPLVRWSLPYCEDMWRRYCCLTSFFFGLSIHALAAKIQPDKVVRWCQNGDFLRPVFAASRVPQISDLHSKFALRPYHVWKYGRHPISGRWD